MTTVYAPILNFSKAPNLTYNILIPHNKKNIFYRFGRACKKTINFFKKSETKIVTLISYWAFETFLFFIIALSITGAVAITASILLYLFGTYAIFSAVNALTK